MNEYSNNLDLLKMWLQNQISRLKRIYFWMARSWPITIPVALIIMWMLFAYRIYPLSAKAITKWTSLMMQIGGGATIIHSINSNFGLIRTQSLFQIFLSYFKEFPWNSKNAVINVTGNHMVSDFLTATAIVTSNPNTIEERVRRLEIDLRNSIEENQKNHLLLNSQINSMEEKIRVDISKQNEKYNLLEKRIDDVGVGGFKGQIFGFLTASIGTVLGAIY